MPTSSLPASVVLATAAEAWPLDEDAEPLCAALAARGVRAEPRVWDDPGSSWHDAELVVVRSTWNYARRREAFLTWSEEVASVTTLCNPPAVLRWNTDKAYLYELEAAGIPIVPTALVEPDLDAAMRHDLLRGHAGVFAGSSDSGEIVVKPTVSAGAKDTGRFGTAQIEAAIALSDRIACSGRTIMVQPYLPAVDRVGETGMVLFDGVLSHAFEKGALLAPGGETEHGLFALERIAPRTPADDELELAAEVIAEIQRRFGVLLYARVDLLRDGDGRPRLLELELSEPSWFLDTDPAAAARAATAITARLSSSRS
jgi:glutathione synthase/RimK-type ligase-like ATP-grasp enzyme